MFLWLNTVAGLGFLWLQAMSSASIRTMWLEKERMRWFRKKEMLLVGYCELSNTRNIIIVLQFWIFFSCLISNKLSPAHMGQRQGTHSGQVSSPLQDTHTMFTITDTSKSSTKLYIFRMKRDIKLPLGEQESGWCMFVHMFVLWWIYDLSRVYFLLSPIV